MRFSFGVAFLFAGLIHAQPELRSGQMISLHGKTYKVVQAIAKGGEGRLYFAYPETLETPVGIKIYRGPMVAQSRSYQNAVRALFPPEEAQNAELPLMRVFDTGEVMLEGRPYPVDITEFGDELDKRILDLTPTHLPAPELRYRLEALLAVLESLGQGVEKIGSSGYVHEDIKPDNVLVRRRGDYAGAINAEALAEGRAVALLSDFGLLAKKNAVATVAGTTLFAPPEKRLASYPFHKKGSDLFSLGLTMATLMDPTFVRKFEDVRFRPDSKDGDSQRSALLRDLENMLITRVSALGGDFSENWERYSPLTQFVEAMLSKDVYMREALWDHHFRAKSFVGSSGPPRCSQIVFKAGEASSFRSSNP